MAPKTAENFRALCTGEKEDAKLKKTPNGPKLVSVVCAVDCGIAVNPNIVAMQMESGIGYGIVGRADGRVTFKEGSGRAEQLRRLPGPAYQ